MTRRRFTSTDPKQTDRRAVQGQGIDIRVDVSGNVLATTEAQEEAKKRKQKLRAAERHLRRVEHRISCLFCLLRGLCLSAAADSAAVQAAALSLAPAPLVDKLQGAVGSRRGALREATEWLRGAVSVDPDAEDAAAALDLTGEDDASLHSVEDVALPAAVRGGDAAARSAALHLLQCAQRRVGGELHVAALFAALLRACGLTTRLVTSFLVRINQLLKLLCLREMLSSGMLGLWTPQDRVE